MNYVIDTEWIERTLASLSIDQKLGQLLHPFVTPQSSLEQVRESLDGVEPGGVFVFPGTLRETRDCIRQVQSLCQVPVIFSSDLENGAGRMIKDATIFPDLMALAATGSAELAYTMGKAAALEGRSVGLHWAFGPVLDINVNPQNPITNTRSLGDDPETVARLGCALIAGMQDHGLCATAKHFPGDGFDARDQHVCTTVNPLSMDAWRAFSGRVFQSAVDAGVWSVMIGHIALPAADAGLHGEGLAAAPPATLSHAITTGLLRHELGFDGVVISDASGMGGFTSHGPRELIAPKAIMAGCDQLLFCQTRRDFEILKRAYHEGRLREERIDEAVRRLLALKSRLGLNRDTQPQPLSAGERMALDAAASRVATEAITLVRDRLGALPLALVPGSRVLSLHLRGDAAYNVDRFDDLLRARGVEVMRYDETLSFSEPPREAIETADAILVHFVFGPSWMTNRIRPNGNYLRSLIDRLDFQDPRLVFVSYGTPYLTLEFPRVPALLNAYSPDPHSQHAVLGVLSGEQEARGHSPVRLELPPFWLGLPSAELAPATP